MPTNILDNSPIKGASNCIILEHVMSQSIPTGYIPTGQPPGISSKNLRGRSEFDFRKLPGGQEFDKDRDFVENESETSTKIAWINFYR